MRNLLYSLLLSAGLSCGAATSSSNLVTNGGFESGLSGWRPLWTRDADMGRVALDREIFHTGIAAARIEHRGTNDRSFEPDTRVAVQAGDIIEIASWVRAAGAGSTTLCASTWTAGGRNVSWSSGERTLQGTNSWTRLRSRFVVPTGVTQVQPRFIGYGPATVWVDDLSVSTVSSPAARNGTPLPPQLALTNAMLEVVLRTTNAALEVHDRRTGRIWRQEAAAPEVMLLQARAQGARLDLDLVHVPSGLDLRASLQLDPTKPEFTYSLSSTGELSAPMRFPYPFATQPGDYLVVPMNEGISYPVEDTSIEPFRLIAYGGHGMCMAFWGVTDGGQGQAAIIETPDDAAIQLQRIEGRLAIAPEWDSQKAQFGYTRQLRYVFFDQGGHVAIAKRYRQYIQAKGGLKTLAEKRRENPAVDLLVGAVNVWNWDSEPVALVKAMQAAGIERILWSRGGPPEALRALNEMKVLTSRYDIYQDVMDPANFPSLRGTHQDWTTAAWPQDIIRRGNGDWLRGWGVKGRQDDWFYCGVLCDSRALDYARRRIPAELATHPYQCRFIDTTTAAPWNECFATNHPMTRSDSREWKMKLLDCVSREFKLVTGSETGHDAAVPFVHYFEGMLSLGPYRVPDSGRDMARIWDEVPERVAKFQLGHNYRLPLWELVYHDCVVAHWYWGDYNNKLPSLWDKRDLFNALYGTPPMFMFNRQLWASQSSRFVRSYKDTCPVARAAGYSEMIDHRFLAADRSVQQTRFANGVTVTVNFGESPFTLPTGETLPSMGIHTSGTDTTPVRTRAVRGKTDAGNGIDE